MDSDMLKKIEKATLKILHCSMALTFGGEQIQLSQILSHIDREHFQSIVCCIRRFGYVAPAIRDLASKFICLQVGSRYNLPGEVLRLRRVIKEHDIDLVVMGIFGSNFSPLLAAWLTRVPVVAFLPTTYDLKARSAGGGGTILYWKSRVFYMVHAVLARLIKVHYIAYSETIKESAVKNLHLPMARISIIPPLLDPNEFDARLLSQDTTSKLKDELGLNGAYPILLNVARLSAVKGQKDLLEVMPRVLERFARAKLLIAGDGPLQRELGEFRDRLNLHHEVLLLGRRDDVRALLHMADLFVFSSVYEGLPGAVIEAMAAGKSVVAFDIPALREIIIDGQTGTLIRGRDIDRLAEAVIHLTEHPEIAGAMGERAQHVVQERFDIRQSIRSLETIYEKVITGSEETKQ
jgi:glycosyltransferase involved in cell wall biosynthesis